MKSLPYQVRTATGDVFDVEFPLHAETVSAVRVAQLITALLDRIDKDIAVAGETSNGDVLQAVAMTLAIRARMIHTPAATTERLAKRLVDEALAAMADASRQQPDVGHA